MSFIQKAKDFLGFDIKEDKYALVDDPIFGKVAKDKAPQKWVRTTCGYCGVGCGMYVGVRNGKAVYSKGDPLHHVNMGTLCPKGLSEHKMIEDDNRVTSPMIRKEGTLQKVSWDEAFSHTSKKFQELQEKYGKESVAVLSTGQLLTEGFYSLGKFVRLGLGVKHFDSNTTLCMGAVVMSHKETFGSDGPVGSYEDFEKADVIILIGANISDNQPILKLHIAKNKKNPKIIVIDPRKTKTAQMADIYLPIKPRSDLALLNGLCYIILEQGWEDEKFIRERTNGFMELKKHIINNYPPQEVANITGIEVKELYNLAKIYAQADAGMIAWTMGINQSAIGTDTIKAISNLALITGNLGKEGGSPMSITGQCNAMGSREFGFTSSIPGYRNYAYPSDREAFANIVNVPVELVPQERGYAYPQMIEAIQKGEIKALWVVGTNPLISFTDQNNLREAFQKLELLVVQDAFMSDTALTADVIFSAATWSEKEGSYTNAERRCNYAQKAVEPKGDAMSDFYIVQEFSKFFDGKYELLFEHLKSPKDAFEEIKRVSKGQLCDYSGMTYERMQNLGGIQWPCTPDNKEGTKRLYDENMPCPTPNGKANLIPVDWIPLSETHSKENPFILNTGRTVEQFHTRTKTGNIGILNDLAPEAWVDINPKDALKLQVKSGDRISISSKRGKVDNIVVKISGSVQEYNIFVPFHYNTQLINLVTLPEYDPISFEPNFKQCAVQLHSKKVPQGVLYEEEKVVALLENQTISLEEEKTEVTIKEKTM